MNIEYMKAPHFELDYGKKRNFSTFFFRCTCMFIPSTASKNDLRISENKMKKDSVGML